MDIAPSVALKLKQSEVFKNQNDGPTIDSDTPDLFVSKMNIRKSVMVQNKLDSGLTDVKGLECEMNSFTESPSPLRNEYYQL